jgi:hypothetical protein
VSKSYAYSRDPLSCAIAHAASTPPLTATTLLAPRSLQFEELIRGFQKWKGK